MASISFSDLTQMEQRLLLAIGFANNFAIKAHNSKQTISRHYDKEMRNGRKVTHRLIKRAWKSLGTKGLISLKKTEGSDTWMLTRTGHILALQLKERLNTKDYLKIR